jgi:hypothetical protein
MLAAAETILSALSPVQADIRYASFWSSNPSYIAQPPPPLHGASRWLSTEREDGRICRELHAATSALAGAAVYQAPVVTNDLDSANRDANVHIELEGQEAERARQQLESGPQDFDRGDEGSW